MIRTQGRDIFQSPYRNGKIMDKHKFVGTIIDISAINPKDITHYDDGKDILGARYNLDSISPGLTYDGDFEWGQFIFIPAGA